MSSRPTQFYIVILKLQSNGINIFHILFILKNNFGGPAGIRTPNLRVRSSTPYPIGPRVHN